MNWWIVAVVVALDVGFLLGCWWNAPRPPIVNNLVITKPEAEE